MARTSSRLNDDGNPPSAAKAALRRLGEIDWDFTAQASESTFSSFHWHPCRFPSQIPAIGVGRFSKPQSLVLDPFMGSATTLVEAQRLGRQSIGIDINPISCLFAAAKTLTSSALEVRAEINKIRLRIAKDWDAFDSKAVPASVQAEKWYMPSTKESLGKLWLLISQLEGVGNVIAKACFSAILLPSCREDRHWGYVCDNSQPKAFREPNAKALFLASMEKLAGAYFDREQQRSSTLISEAKILEGDSAKILSDIKTNTVDCVITSPPYFGVADYVKAQRLSMEWFGYQIEPLRKLEIGARSKRHRNQALNEYISDLRNVFIQVHRVMRPNAIATIVFGQSPSRPDAQNRFKDDLLSIGFSLEMERLRQIPVNRRQMPSLVRETVFVLRK